MHPSSVARLEQSTDLCQVLSEYVMDHGATIVLRVNEIPVGVWDEQPGQVIGPGMKRELVGPHVIEYWKEGT